MTADTALIGGPGGGDLLVALQGKALAKLHLAEQPLAQTLTVRRQRQRLVADAATGRLAFAPETVREPWVVVCWTLAHLEAFVAGPPARPLRDLVAVVRATNGPDAVTFLVLDGLPMPRPGFAVPDTLAAPGPAHARLDRARLDDALIALELTNACRVTEVSRGSGGIAAAVVAILEAIAERPYQYAQERAATGGEGGRRGRGSSNLSSGTVSPATGPARPIPVCERAGKRRHLSFMRRGTLPLDRPRRRGCACCRSVPAAREVGPACGAVPAHAHTVDDAAFAVAVRRAGLYER